MIRTALYVVFLALCLNISQISADETTPSQTTTDSIDKSGSHANNTVESNQRVNITATESSTETAVTTIEDQDPTKKTTRSISSNEVEWSTNNSENPEPTTAVNSNVDTIIESLLMKPEWKYRNIWPILTRKTQGEEPGYLGKLTGNLVFPALEATSRLSNAWDQATQGSKDVGRGAYEAAAGTMNFVKSAASAIWTSG